MVQGKPELTSDSPKSFDVSPASGSPGRAIAHTPKERCWAFCFLVLLKKNLIFSFNFPETPIFNSRTQRNALGAGLLGSTPQVSHRSARPSRELGLRPATARGCSSTCLDRRDTVPAPRQLLSDTSNALETPLGPRCDFRADLLGVFQPGSVLRWRRLPSRDANSTSQTSQ